MPRDRVRTDLETVSRAAEELDQQAAAARGVSRLLRAGLRRRHLAADGALAEGAAAATGRWLQLREQAERAAERLRKHAAVQEHTDSDWAELESGVWLIYEYAADSYAPVYFELTDTQNSVVGIYSPIEDSLTLHGFWSATEAQELLDYLNKQ